jgi:hypothetical protein
LQKDIDSGKSFLLFCIANTFKRFVFDEDLSTYASSCLSSLSIECKPKQIVAASAGKRSNHCAQGQRPAQELQARLLFFHDNNFNHYHYF